MLSEALITEVDEMLPMVTNMEASATVVAEELDQYMPMAHEPAVKRPMAASSGPELNPRFKSNWIATLTHNALEANQIDQETGQHVSH